MFDKARSIFVIHNMGYHGVYPNPPNWESPRFSFRDFGLSDDAYYDRYVWTFPVDERPSKGRDPRDTGEAIKLLRGGIEMADRVVTVAPRYIKAPPPPSSFPPVFALLVHARWLTFPTRISLSPSPPTIHLCT